MSIERSPRRAQSRRRAALLAASVLGSVALLGGCSSDEASDDTTTTVAVGSQAPTSTEQHVQYPFGGATSRFLRRERVTVPAGTFDACVFESRDPGAPEVTGTTWVADGKGFTLKTVAASGGVTNATTVTVSIRFNSQPVTN